MPEYASWPRRIAALVIDWIVSTLVTIGIVGLGDYSRQGGNSSWVVLGVFALEVSLLTTLAGGSFGQLLVRVRVLTTERPPAEPAAGDRPDAADLRGDPAADLQVRKRAAGCTTCGPARRRTRAEIGGFPVLDGFATYADPRFGT